MQVILKDFFPPKWAEANGNTNMPDYLNNCFESHPVENVTKFVKENVYSCFVKPGCLRGARNVDGDYNVKSFNLIKYIFNSKR